MSEELLAFKIGGKALITLLKQLKPAFPKKAAQERTLATIAVRPNHVTFTLPGAAVGAIATATKCFRVELPFSELKFLRDEPFKPDAEVAFAFESKRMIIGAISIGNARIHVVETDDQSPTGTVETSVPTIPSEVSLAEDSQDGFIGYPLLGIYQTLRQHPPHTFTGNPRLQAGEAEIDGIMKKIDKLLKPLGLGQHDILELLDKRIGLKK